MHAGILAGVSALDTQKIHASIRCRAYQLGIELRKARLTGIVKDKYSIDHDAEGAAFQPFSRVKMSRWSLLHRIMSDKGFHLRYEPNVEL